MGNKDFEKLHPDAKKCMRLGTAIWSGIVLIIEVVIAVIMGFDQVPMWLWIIFGVITALLVIYLVVSPRVRYDRYLYVIDSEAIRVREGFLWISYSVVPIERLHKIELSQGPIARAFHFFTVTVTTAGGDVNIKFLKEDVANRIAEQLREVINQMAAEERSMP